MPFYKVEELPKSGKLIAFDVGTKTYGVAFSDGLRMVASPFETIKRTKWKEDKKRVEDILKDERVVAAVVGLPLHMSGERGESAERAISFANLFENEFGIPTLLWDERLSSFAAENILKDSGFKKAKHKKYIDSVAAAVILQAVIDKMQFMR